MQIIQELKQIIEEMRKIVNVDSYNNALVKCEYLF